MTLKQAMSYHISHKRNSGHENSLDQSEPAGIVPWVSQSAVLPPLWSVARAALCLVTWGRKLVAQFQVSRPASSDWPVISSTYIKTSRENPCDNCVSQRRLLFLRFYYYTHNIFPLSYLNHDLLTGSSKFGANFIVRLVRSSPDPWMDSWLQTWNTFGSICVWVWGVKWIRKGH